MVAPSLQTGGYFTTSSKLESQADMVEAFQRGLSTATQYALDNPEEVPAIIPEFLSIPAEVVASIQLPQLITKVDTEHIEILGELGERYGLLKGDPRLDQLIAGLPSR